MAGAIVSIEASSEQDVLSKCRDVIARGGLIAYPTDTFYGLGVNPRNREAVRRLFSIKQRVANQPILLLLKDIEEVGRWAEPAGTTAKELMARHWPGPLTLVLKARADVLPELTAGTGTIGLRVPGNALTRKVLEAVGGALTGTSANRSGAKDARTAPEVSEYFGDAVDLILDGGPAPGSKPSTIVDVSGRTPRLIRRGAVDVDLGAGA